jgi:hypothetical protein
VRGFVRDADDLPLHGATVTAGGQTAYTDYDGSRKTSIDRDGVTGDFELPNVLIGHNVTFAGAFGRFAPAEADALTAAAADLAGGTYTASVGVDEVLNLNSTLPDGGLPVNTPMTLRPIFLTDYATVAPDSSIRLQKDLRNDKNSDRISAKPKKPIAASARYRKGVETVTSRLSSLGFLEAPGAPLLSVAALKKNKPAERALKLFKEIRFGPAPGASTRPPKPKGIVDEATLAALNEHVPADGPLWTNVLPPKWSAAPGLADAYVHRDTLDAMRELAEGSTATGFVLTRGSPPLGGTGKTFRIGGEIEFRWIDTAGTSQTPGSFWEPLDGVARTNVTLLGGPKLGVPDPAELNVTWRYAAAYDQARTLQAIQLLLDDGAVRVSFNDPAILEQLGAAEFAGVAGKRTIALPRADLQPAPGHDAVVSAAFAFTP